MIPNLDSDTDPTWRAQQMRHHEIGQLATIMLILLFSIVGLAGGGWLEVCTIGDRYVIAILASAIGAVTGGLAFAGLYEVWSRITRSRMDAESRQIDADIHASIKRGRRFFTGDKQPQPKVSDPVRMVADALRRGGR